MNDIDTVKREIKKGRKQDAIKMLGEMLEQDINDVNAWYLLSQVLDELKEKQYCYNQVLRVYPNHPKILEELRKLGESEEKKEEKTNVNWKAWIYFLVGALIAYAVFRIDPNLGLDNDQFCSPLFFLLMVSMVLVYMSITHLSPYAQKQEQRQKAREWVKEYKEQARKKLKEEKERERKMNVEKKYMSWDPRNWRDKTKSITKTSADLWGSYDEIHERWNDKKMRLYFSYERERYILEIDFDTCLEIQSNQEKRVIYSHNGRIKGRDTTIFYYESDWYYTHEKIDLDDAAVLIEATKKQNKEKLRRKIERARNMLEGQDAARQRERIPDSVKSFVWNRDGGKCVKCGSKEKLEFDHIIPFSKGGSNTARNLQLLCEECNRKKGNKIG
jgi:hypothetical protein